MIWPKLLVMLLLAGSHGPDYKIQAIKYGTIAQYPVSGLVVGAPEGEMIDIPLAFWLIRGNGRNILFDCGFYRQKWNDEFDIEGYIRPDEAVRRAGLKVSDITDLILSHAHWDHMGGIDLFPDATLYIQRTEYDYYVGEAWQDGGQTDGIDPEDIVSLVKRNITGTLKFIDGDDTEVLPGIRAFTGGRHTFASQYLLIETDPPYVLASDNAYLYRNLEEMAPIATFAVEDGMANIQALKRMVSLAGAIDRVIPGHDPAVFDKFPGDGRIVTIR